MQPERVLETFESWRRLGWMRPLEARFVEFLASLEPGSDGRVLLAGGLVSHALSQGHVCVDLRDLIADPARILALPPEDNSIHANGIMDESELATARAAIDQDIAALDIDAWLAALHQSRLVGSGEGTTPLVLDGTLLFLRRNWDGTREVRHALAERGTSLDAALPPAELRALFDALFAAPENGGEPDWQKIACAVALRYPFSVITGGPGTGKTWTMVKLLGLLQGVNAKVCGADGRPLRIMLAAPTGKAAARMTESMRDNWQQLPVDYRDERFRPEDARTLHRLLGSRPDSRHFRHDRHNPLPGDVIVVDEASMIDLQMMQALCRAVAPKTRLVLLGDKDQLASVEPGAVFGDLCQGAEEVNFDPDLVDWVAEATGERVQAGGGRNHLSNQVVMLRRSHRFNRDIAALAAAVNAGQAEDAVGLLKERKPALNSLRPASEDDADLRRLIVNEGYARYLQVVREPPVSPQQGSMAMSADDSADPEVQWIRECLGAWTAFQVLAATRSGIWGVEGLNTRIRRWLADDGLVPESGAWFHGRPVLITRNDYRTGLMNGDVGLCLELPQPDGSTTLRVVFQRADGTLHRYSPNRIVDCRTAWAITVHKSQGSEFDHAVLVLPDRYSRVLTRELVYTGLTRARDRFTLIAPGEEGLFARAVQTCTDRFTALAPGGSISESRMREKPHALF